MISPNVTTPMLTKRTDVKKVSNPGRMDSSLAKTTVTTQICSLEGTPVSLTTTAVVYLALSTGFPGGFGSNFIIPLLLMANRLQPYSICKYVHYRFIFKICTIAYQAGSTTQPACIYKFDANSSKKFQTATLSQ